MERKIFNDFAELGNHMYELASEKSQVVTAVLLYEDAIDLIKWLMLYDDVSVGSINVENEDYHGYDNEFYITLDTDLVLDVVPAYQLQTDKTAEGYLTLESDVVLYGGDTSSKLATQNTYDNKYEIVIKNYDDNNECGDCCGDCSNCYHRETSKTISRALNLFDFILNHLGDN